MHTCFACIIRFGMEVEYMTPRNPAQYGPGGRGFFGTVTVGTRGQVSIPAQARKSLGLEPGDQLVVLTDPAQGLALVPLSLLLAQHADTNPLAALVRTTMAGDTPPEADSDPTEATPPRDTSLRHP